MTVREYLTQRIAVKREGIASSVASNDLMKVASLDAQVHALKEIFMAFNGLPFMDKEMVENGKSENSSRV